MFKDLRPGSSFFIFEKGEKTNLQTGSVVAVGQPTIKPQANFNTVYPHQPEYTVDIRIKVGEEFLNFNQLPANLAIADSQTNTNQKIVVSESRDLIRAEIETTMANSKAIVESVPKHERIINECEEILQQINPSFAKEKEQKEVIKGLEDKIANLEKQLGGIAEIKNMLMQKQSPKNN